jgi:ParB-like chromosome segregation protein Spo0J
VLVQRFVVEYPVADLVEHPANPRRGDVEAIAASIDANGFYGAIVVQESTGLVLAGNHRLRAARRQGLDVVPVAVIDVDDERAKRILLADNRTSDLGAYDDELLRTLLEELAAEADGLTGTGYDDADLTAMLDKLERDGPDQFPVFDEDAEVDHRCPACGYEWRGMAKDDSNLRGSGGQKREP